MAARATLTDKKIEDLKSKASRYTVRDPELRGHYVRVTPNGAKSFVAVARDPYGKQVWATIGDASLYTVADARDKARTAIKRVKAGEEPFPAPPVQPDSFKAVALEYLKRHVIAKGLLSKDEIERILERYVYPKWKDRAFISIKKSDVSKLLDAVEDESAPRATGKRQADYVLSVVRGIMRWQAERMDDYVCPVTGRMRRTDPKKRKRERTLTDDELRLLWPLFGAAGQYGAMCKLGLLTAQRLDKIASMKRADVSDDGVWTIQTDERGKGTGEALTLPKVALDVIRAQPCIEDNEFVFAGRFKGHFNGYSRAKELLDEAVTKAAGDKEIPGWVFHDLRRTARSLMARAKVDSEHAERVLGHSQREIVETYDRHKYDAEKRVALAKLATLIGRILNPAPNVTQLSARRKAQQ